MSDWGAKASISGDVETAAVADLCFSSKYVTPKIKPEHFDTYTHTFSSNPPVGVTTLLTIAHGYSYVPGAIVFFTDHQSSNRFACLPAYLGVIERLTYDTDATNFKIYYEKDFELADPTGDSYTFKYIILADDGD